jgi:hypothetical protein
MPRISPVSHSSWTGPAAPEVSIGAQEGLEAGAVLLLPNLGFVIADSERAIFSPDVLTTSKNVSFDPSKSRLSGTTLTGKEGETLHKVIERFSNQSEALAGALLGGYGGKLQRARASFRPAEIAGRPTSWRKDDTRLHVDSFPASPVQGRRILRLFTNVNPEGRPRSWRVGDAFEHVARRFAPALGRPLPGSGALLQLLHITKSRRTAYDALMLQLHDRMKSDAEFQSSSPQVAFDFAPGSTWIAFTDEVPHAAMAGQYQLEQTFLLPVSAMRHPERSPLRILERITERKLV